MGSVWHLTQMLSNLTQLFALMFLRLCCVSARIQVGPGVHVDNHTQYVKRTEQLTGVPQSFMSCGNYPMVPFSRYQESNIQFYYGIQEPEQVVLSFRMGSHQVHTGGKSTTLCWHVV